MRKKKILKSIYICDVKEKIKQMACLALFFKIPGDGECRRDLAARVSRLLCSIYDIMRKDTQPVTRAIGVSHTACKDEFRQNIRSHKWSVFSFFIICVNEISRFFGLIRYTIHICFV